MKKLVKIVMVAVLSLGMISCSSKSDPEWDWYTRSDGKRIWVKRK